MQQRYYDPIAGRFLSVDPVTTNAENGSFFGRYHYANNNPYKYVDPDGRSPVHVGLKALDLAVSSVEIMSAFHSGGAGAGIRATVDALLSVPGARAGGAIMKGLDRIGGVAKGAKANGGIAPKHGGTTHNDAIDQRVRALQSDSTVSNIRKNQQQVDVNGNKVGTNRPDLQYDKSGCHRCVEYDTVPRNSTRHGDVIRANDPKTKIELNQL
jgi:hypothetical protein